MFPTVRFTVAFAISSRKRYLVNSKKNFATPWHVETTKNQSNDIIARGLVSAACCSLFLIVFLSSLGSRDAVILQKSSYKETQIISTIYQLLQPDGQSLFWFGYMLISLVEQNYIWNNARTISRSELLLESIPRSRFTSLWISIWGHSGPQK